MVRDESSYEEGHEFKYRDSKVNAGLKEKNGIFLSMCAQGLASPNSIEDYRGKRVV